LLKYRCIFRNISMNGRRTTVGVPTGPVRMRCVFAHLSVASMPRRAPRFAAFHARFRHIAFSSSPATAIVPEEIMATQTIEELKQRALGTIWEIRATDNDFAEAIKPERIARVKDALTTLQAHAENAAMPEEERRAALAAIAEIETPFRSAVGEWPRRDGG
jgi:hypothetical protein